MNSFFIIMNSYLFTADWIVLKIMLKVIFSFSKCV